jgi:uncharacterized repeat protein (TIGR02543 family)
MQINKWVISLLVIVILLSALCVSTHAEDEPAFRYELTVDGQDTIEVNTGDIITVTLYLYRTDANTSYTMYAMQDEIRYDSDFFELVEDSELLFNGIHSTDINVGGGFREFYMNYVSFSGGAQWQPKMRIGSFRLRVIGTSGVSTITNEDFLVSHEDGMGSYDCESNKLTVIVNTECEVRFESNGGTKIDPVTVIFGEKLTRPEDPVREGMRFEGWYTDIHLSQQWDFDTDTVRGNMKLYAKWTIDDIGSETESDTTEPDTTEPDTTEPETTEPETTEPDTTEPETTEPETTEPDTTEPETTEPDTTEPETTEPETTEPETTEPETTEPGTPSQTESETDPVTEQETEPVVKKGCKSMLGASAVSLIICLAAAFVTKKRISKQNDI